MFSQDNNEEKKLDWMYKGPTSTVDREEYLLGRSIDKSLEQMNSGEKPGQSCSSNPKNHVEHECIPPSIRDFKKMQMGEQVDLAQKLQEDPLVAIRKREEETRQKLLQNPVKLKKLQKVLKLKKEDKKKKKKRDKKHKNKKKTSSDSSSDSDNSENLDKKYTKRYEELKKHMHVNEEPEEDELDKILIKKFMQFKHLLTKKDLDEILNSKNGSDSSSDERINQQNKYKPDSDHNDSSDDNTKRKNKGFTEKGAQINMGANSRYKRNFGNDKERNKATSSNYRRNIAEEKGGFRNNRQGRQYFEERNKNLKIPDDGKTRNHRLEEWNPRRNVSEDRRRDGNKKNIEEKDTRRFENREKNMKKHGEEEERRRNYSNTRNEKKYAEHQKGRSKHRSSSSSEEEYVKRSSDKRKEDEKGNRKKNKRRKSSSSDSSDDEDRKKKLNRAKKDYKEKRSVSSDNSDANKPQEYTYNGDSDENKAQKKRNFGLVKADGTKIHLPKKEDREKRRDKKDSRKEIPQSSQTNKYKQKRQRLTEEEQEQRRREMMQNAEWRDEERERNVKRYREEDSKETKNQEYDTNFIKRELLKSANNSTVESRIKSNVYNIQRSGKDMSTNFSRRY